MHPYIEILKLQFRQLRWTILSLTVVIAAFVLLMMGIYPGEDGLGDLLEVLQSESFQIFIGSIPISTSEFYAVIWVQFGLLSFFPFLMLAFGVFFGVELIGREQSEGTFDITFSAPQHRLTFISVRFLGFTAILVLLVITGIISTLIGFALVNEQISLIVIIQIWFVMGVQSFFGLSLGFLIGSAVFDRSFGFQLAFLYVIVTMFQLLIVNGIASLLGDLGVLDLFNSLSVLSYLKSADILYFNNFDISVLYPLIITSFILIFLGIVIFIKRDLNESSFKPFYIYFNPLYWIRKRKPENLSAKSESKATEVPFSRYPVAWSRKYRSRFPAFVDDLWAHGMVLTIFILIIFLLVFLQLMFYPGETDTILLLRSFEATPLYLLISGGQPIAVLIQQPYLGFAVSQYYFLWWIIYTPYFVYRFYTLETRDYNTTTGDLLWAKPISDRSVYLQRLGAILVEYYILILVSIFSFLIPDLIFGNSIENIITQIILLHMTIPAFLGIGILTSLLIAYFPKKKNLALIPVVSMMLLHLAGSLNPAFSILSQLTPFYYLRVVPILFSGFIIEDFLYMAIFSILIFIGIFIRLQKKEHYISN